MWHLVINDASDQPTRPEKFIKFLNLLIDILGYLECS